MAISEQVMDDLLAVRRTYRLMFDAGRKDRTLNLLKIQHLGVAIFIKKLEKKQLLTTLSPEEGNEAAAKISIDIDLIRRGRESVREQNAAILRPFVNTQLFEDLDALLAAEKDAADTIMQRLTSFALSDIC
jgi:hypothetical protein